VAAAALSACPAPAAEHLRGADVTALAAEQVDLELLELEQRQQIGQALIHGAPRAARLPSTELEGAVHQRIMAGESTQVLVGAAFLEDRSRKGHAGGLAPPMVLVCASTRLSPGAR